MSIIPPNPVMVKIACDTNALELALNELVQLSIDAPDAFLEGLSSATDRFFDLVRFDGDGSATSNADELTIAIQPSEVLRGILATARTGDFNLSAFGHGSSSAGCVDSTSEERASAESQGSVGACPTNSQGE